MGRNCRPFIHLNYRLYNKEHKYGNVDKTGNNNKLEPAFEAYKSLIFAHDNNQVYLIALNLLSHKSYQLERKKLFSIKTDI